MEHFKSINPLMSESLIKKLVHHAASEIQMLTETPDIVFTAYVISGSQIQYIQGGEEGSLNPLVDAYNSTGQFEIILVGTIENVERSFYITVWQNLSPFILFRLYYIQREGVFISINELKKPEP